MTNSSDTSNSSEPALQTPLWRLIDAAANRGAEGLRVVEDYARFALNDRHLVEQLKTVRHELTETLLAFAASSRNSARDTLADVGCEVTTAAEMSRADLESVALASFKRSQQALRSLAEFGKLIDPTAAARFEMLRYRLYTLEQAFTGTVSALERLQAVRLCVLLDGQADAAKFQQLVDQVLAGGADMLQLRDAKLTDRGLLERAQLLRTATRRAGKLMIVNNRPDVAVAVEADGVHVGQDDLPVSQVRPLVGPQALIGVSTHTIDQAQAAVLAGANYLGVGPTFPSTTKTFDTFAGLAFVTEVATEIRLPAFAIGGIDAQNIAQVTAAGLARVAVSAAVTGAVNPTAVARQLQTHLTSTAPIPTGPTLP